MLRNWLLFTMVPVGAVVGAGFAAADQPMDQDPPAFSVLLQARDAITQEPVGAIRVVPASGDAARKTRTWQSQYAKTYTESPARFSMKRGWEKVDVRIDADGYRPAILSALDRQRHAEPRLVELIPDNGPAGRILQPDGKPALEADVAMCTRTCEVMVREGRISYFSHGEALRTLIRTDSAGRFALPAEIDEAVIVIAHPSGYAEVLPAQLAKSPDVALQAWSRVEGRLLVGGVPVPDQKIAIQAGRGDLDVILHYSNDTASDSNGNFTAERVPPVSLYVSAVFRTGNGARLQSLVLNAIKFEPGATTRLSLPREGIPVVGRLKLPADRALPFTDVEVKATFFHQTNDWKFQDGTGEDKSLNSPLIAPPAPTPVTLQPDGSFRIESLPEGSYFMSMAVTRKRSDPSGPEGAPLFRAVCSAQIPPKGASNSVLDVGEVQMQPVPRPPAVVTPAVE